MLLITLAVMISAIWLKPTISMAKIDPINLDAAFPENFSDWKVDTLSGKLEITPELVSNLDKLYSQTLTRTYINADGDRVMLSVAYGENQLSDVTQVHRPEFCYVAQGFSLLGSQESLITLNDKSIQVKNIISERSERHEFITYWIVVGKKSILPGVNRKLTQLEYGFSGYIPDGMLVRVSSIGIDDANNKKIQDQFIKSMYQSIDKKVVNKVFGSL